LYEYKSVPAGKDKSKPLPLKCDAPECQRKPRTRVADFACCGLHEQRFRKYGKFDLPERKEKPWQTCTIEGCQKQSRTRLGALCEMHYYRRYKTGSFDDPVFKRRYIAPNGYVRIIPVGEHPLVDKNGGVYEHRKVLFDRIGWGVHKCVWCACEIEWLGVGSRKLVADHMDGNKQNNTPGNLEPACHRCNANRGLFMNWVMKHKNDPFLWRMFEIARGAKDEGA